MELVIAEKPSVAQSIAAVLGATQRKDGYLEGNDYLVSWCVGHLVELVQPESYEEAWKKWSYDNLPIIPQEWQHEVKSDTKAQYQILKKLMHDDRVDAVVCATDAGREGELIFRLTYNMAGCRKPMKRLWISSMEESAIRDGFHNLRPGSDYDNLYKSALCRQEADWLVGINGTRLFTVLYGGKALKVGRVQTPTLAMLVDRESKIMNFKKEAYYMAHIMENGLDAVSEHISDKTEAERIAGACENGQALVTSVVKEEKWVAPPKLYDLTTLQRDANRLFGFTAKQTLEYTQSLYEKKLVTYPRTDSQYLSDDMDGTARNVIEAIFNSLLFEQDIMFNPDIKRILNSKKVTDHHAIIPTMEIIKQDLKAIPESEMKILSLCANRLLCATGEKHIYNSTKAVLTCNNTVFKVSGKVKIFRYVTEGTFDSYSWQLIENKQKFIGQIMTSKSPVRSCEDIDEAALSYAEVKALATGNPYIKEKMDLDIQVSKLKLLKANHTSQRYRLEDNIAKHYPMQITALKERLEGYRADIQTYAAHKPVDKDAFSMKIGNRTYTDKKEAGAALIDMCRSAKQPNMAVTIGEYQGFKMSVSFDSFFSKFTISLKGSLSHEVEIGADPLGNLQRLSNALEGMTGKMADVEQKLSNVEHQLETAKVEVTKPFAQEQELAEKLERLAELNTLLNMDEKGDNALDMGDDEPEDENGEQSAQTQESEPNRAEDIQAVAEEPLKPVASFLMSERIAEHDKERMLADGSGGRVSVKEKLAEMKQKIFDQKMPEKPETVKSKGKEESL